MGKGTSTKIEITNNLKIYLLLWRTSLKSGLPKLLEIKK